ERDGIDSSPFGVAKEAGGPERNSPLPNAIQGFFEGLGDEPKHAAHFAKEIFADFADFLHYEDRIRRDALVLCFRHFDREVASGDVGDKANSFTSISAAQLIAG